MIITRGCMCIVIRTAHPEYLGRICTCVDVTPHPLGAYVFQFQNGIQARGNRRNVQPITPPNTDTTTRRNQEISA